MLSLIFMAGFIVGKDLEEVAPVLSLLPACAKTCATSIISALACNTSIDADLAACLCPDFSVQRRIASCVQSNCTWTNQLSVEYSYKKLCDGYPIPSRAGHIRSVAIILLALTVPFVLARFYSRIRVTKGIGWDDFALMIAAVLSISTLSLSFPLTNLGFGKHSWTIPSAHINIIRQLFWVGQIQYGFIQTLTKVSLIIFFLRIFTLQKWTRRGCYLVLGFLGLKCIVFLMIVIFQCTPVNSMWNFSIPGHCVNVRVLVLLAGGLSLLEDFAILCLPIPSIKSLNIGAGKKITASMMFSIGSLACIISMVRLRFLVDFGAYIDITWDDVDAFTWSVIENSLALICACLPALRPLLCMLAPKVFGVFSHSSDPLQPKVTLSTLRQSWRMNRQGSKRIADDEPPKLNLPQDIEDRKLAELGASTMVRWESDEDTLHLVVLKTDGTKGVIKQDVQSQLRCSS